MTPLLLAAAVGLVLSAAPAHAGKSREIFLLPKWEDHDENGPAMDALSEYLPHDTPQECARSRIVFRKAMKAKPALRYSAARAFLEEQCSASGRTMTKRWP